MLVGIFDLIWLLIESIAKLIIYIFKKKDHGTVITRRNTFRKGL